MPLIPVGQTPNQVTLSNLNTALSAVKPTVTMTIRDQFQNIAGVFSGNVAGNVSDNQGGNKYLLQKLVPNTKYKLTFTLVKYEGSIGTTVINDLTAASVYNLPTSSTGVPADDSLNPYFWHDSSGNLTLAFRTTTDNNTNTELENPQRIDSSVEGYRPVNTCGFNVVTGRGFYYNLHTDTQQPIDLSGNSITFATNPINLHRLDGFIFIFPYVASPTSESLTTKFLNNEFLGYNPTSLTKGFKHVIDIHAYRTKDLNPFSTADFIASDSNLNPTFGGPLDKNTKYTVAMMVYDNTSDHILYTKTSDVSQTKIYKWFSGTLDAAGTWAVYLKYATPINSINNQLYPSTAIAIELDGISTSGAVNDTDVFALTITAVPFD